MVSPGHVIACYYCVTLLSVQVMQVFAPYYHAIVVNNCFFVESRQAKRHQRDITSHAVEKIKLR